MIICLCHRVSDRDIDREVRQGCASFAQLQDETRVATGCGACAACAHDTFASAQGRHAMQPIHLSARHPAQSMQSAAA